MKKQLIECVPNFSEGNDMHIIEQITAAMKTVEGISVIDVDPGKATNRTVVTMVGEPEPVCEAAFRAVKKAAELIDMNKHKGAHPRFGATDVCPLVPVSNITMEETVEYARKLARRIGEELHIPVYCYESAAYTPERRNLANCRSGEYEALGERLGSEKWHPDFGPRELNDWTAKTGAIAVGARNFLVAYNVNLNTTSTRRANSIAFDVRERGRAKREGNPITGKLVKDENGVWRMDFEDMERRIVENHIHAAVFCSPHNPCGRVWERDEIERAMDIYRQHDCVVISDEIWSDIILPGHKHIPTQSVSEDARMRTVALYAPSKTFNLAGLVGSYHIIYNETLRDRMCAVSNKTHYNEMNVLSMHALIGAYQPQGYEWVDELNQVLAGNIEYFCDYVDEHFEGVSYSRPQGTYMVFLDCTEWCREHGRDIQWLLDEGARVGVGYQDGRPFHGPCHIRVNLALPLSRVREACDRLDRYVFNAR